MPSGPGERYDFFLSRRGSVAPIAQEVADVLTEKGYKVLIQDYDIPLAASFMEAMHEAIIKLTRPVILFTEDYLRSPYTRKEFTSFEAERAQRRRGAPHHRLALRRRAVTRAARRQRLSRPRGHRGPRGAQAAHYRRSRAPIAGSATATATIHRGAAAHRQLHRPRRRT